MKISSIFLLAAFILILFIGLPSAAYGAEPKVIGITKTGVIIDIGADAGVKIGMKGKIFYYYEFRGRTGKAYVAKFIIKGATRINAEGTITEQSEEAKIDYLVEFDGTLVRPDIKAAETIRIDAKPQISQPKGTLIIFTDPKDTAIYINGELVGRSSEPISLKPGEYDFTIRAYGYMDISEHVIVIPGKNVEVSRKLKEWELPPLIEMEISLFPERSKGSLKVITIPPRAYLFINGDSMGFTGETVALAEGTYEIKITLDGYQDYSTRAVIKANEISIENCELKRLLPKLKATWETFLEWSHPAPGGLPIMEYIKRKPRGPGQIAVDSNGDIYLTIAFDRRIHKYSPNRRQVSSFGIKGKMDVIGGLTTAIAIDSDGNVYVANRPLGQVQKYGKDGKFILGWGSKGSGDGQFDWIGGLSVDEHSNIYVADTTNHRVQKFTSSGSFIMKWGSQGNGPGQFNKPSGIAVDNRGYVYVGDYQNSSIQKFSTSGEFILYWSELGLTPGSIAVDDAGNIFIGGGDYDQLKMVSAEGELLGKWGESGACNSCLDYATDVAVSKKGDIYIIDSNNWRIQRLTLHK